MSQFQSIVYSKYTIFINCGFYETQTITARHQRSSDIGGLAKCLNLKLESKVMFNLYVQHSLVNAQNDFVKDFEKQSFRNLYQV